MCVLFTVIKQHHMIFCFWGKLMKHVGTAYTQIKTDTSHSHMITYIYIFQ